MGQCVSDVIIMINVVPKVSCQSQELPEFLDILGGSMDFIASNFSGKEIFLPWKVGVQSYVFGI